MIIGDVNRTLMGWFEYFKHSQKTTFPSARQLDSEVAFGVCCATRKAGEAARCGNDHHRWPNALLRRAGAVLSSGGSCSRSVNPLHR